MPTDTNQNGWNEYSKLVLKELETLAKSIAGLREELQEVKQELAKMQVKEDKVEELKEWKSKIDEITSPTQLKDYLEKINELQTFKVRAVTVFAVIQFGMAAAMWALNMFG